MGNFKFNLAKKIFFSFLLIILFYMSTVYLGYTNLSSVEQLSEKVVPYNLQMLSLQDLSTSLNTFERAVDQYLIVWNYENEEKAANAVQSMKDSLEDLSSRDNGKLETEIETLRGYVEEIETAFLSIVSLQDSGVKKSNAINQKIVFTYNKIEQAKKQQIKIMNDNSLLVKENSMEQLKIIKRVLTQFVVIGIAVLIIVFVLSMVLTKTISKPIQQLTKAVREVGEGNVDVTIPTIKSNDEVKDLSDAIVTVIGAVKFLKEHQKKDKVVKKK